ncbi:hypothetical protein BRC81_02825 [Halobacteriales archaeon QS_1_68_20]|nr:MAG: hypothetical protein BRC81_02825 [Halobacteriales archaeon QS_1_68_20]
MRLKPVPEPPGDLETVERAQRAVPLVPGTEDDCCARLEQRLDLDSRDTARTWLTFLRALGLVEEGTSGFTRTRAEIDRETLAESFRGGVFGAREVLDALAAEGRLSPEEAFDRFEQHVPEWERHKGAGWQRTWRERVRRLLEWAVLLGLAERADGSYRPR